MPNLVPQSRLLTIALVAGLVALIIFGFVSQNPLTGAVLGVLVVFFAIPALIVYVLNRRARRDNP